MKGHTPGSQKQHSVICREVPTGCLRYTVLQMWMLCVPCVKLKATAVMMVAKQGARL